MGTIITHLLDERDDTREFTGSNVRWWTAEWFPFRAEVWKFLDAKFDWKLYLVGSDAPFVSGEADAWSEAFQQVADAQRAALMRLRAQLLELE